ncbi:uncharacterized protein LOC123561003 [Mercenaria mercenaria]|uniref:uncharacterized protein LOC123561003 n=1 Tax=Mercenaria mercenaria TaxID=6596 RepID=UPI00234E4AA9|nr:uncharacterized protein LOC123561003 [Mercenaria mercenaria]
MERAEVITISTNKKLKLQYKIDKIHPTNLVHSNEYPTNLVHSNEHSTHLVHSNERRAYYSPGRSCEVESPVGPESILKDHIKRKTENNKITYENDITTEKSVTFLEIGAQQNSEHVGIGNSEKNQFHKTKSCTYSNLDSEIKIKVKAAKNKNQTLRLAKRKCENTWRNSLLELSEGQSDTRNDVPENEEQRLPKCDGEIDENRDFMQSQREGIKDFIVHSSDDDYDTAMVFRDDLLKLGIPDLAVDNFVHVNPQKTEMESISSLHEQCNTVLIFVTNNYAKDKLRRRQAEMLLLKGMAIESFQNWVVPVWVDKDVKKSVLELAPIKGIQYYQSNQKKTDFSKQVTELVMAGRGRCMDQEL